MANFTNCVWSCCLVAILTTGLSCTSQPPPPKSATPSTVAATPAPDVASTTTASSELVETPAVIETPEKTLDPLTPTKEEPTSPAMPLDLTQFYVMRAANFEKIKQYAWRFVPIGQQTFANVPLQLDGAMFLWGERNAKNGQVYAEQIKEIPIGRSFETLYIYHSVFFEGEAGKPVYDIIFHYDDDSSAQDSILNRDDVRDWYGNQQQKPLGPTGKRATLAWSGDAENNVWVRYSLTAVKNPHPERVVKSLDFVSAKSQTAGCILGLTIGKAGLMIPAKEQDDPAKE